MGCLGNLLWFIFGGFLSGLSWTLTGCLWCITIIGIPVGMQCFKFAALSFFPFGKEVRYGGGAGSFLFEFNLAHRIRSAPGNRIGAHRGGAVHYGDWNSFRASAVQTGEAGTDAVRKRGVLNMEFPESGRGKRGRRWKRNGPRLKGARPVSWNGRRKRAVAHQSEAGPGCAGSVKGNTGCRIL